MSINSVKVYKDLKFNQTFLFFLLYVMKCEGFKSLFNSLEKCTFKDVYISSSEVSLEFLKQQTDLKHLRLDRLSFSNEDFQMICELKNLEMLELDGWAFCGSSNLGNLYKLKKLKSLKAGSQYFSRIILNRLKFGVFNNLEELDANFYDASVESSRELSMSC